MEEDEFKEIVLDRLLEISNKLSVSNKLLAILALSDENPIKERVWKLHQMDFSNKDIAISLGIKENLVRAHISNKKKELGFK